MREAICYRVGPAKKYTGIMLNMEKKMLKKEANKGPYSFLPVCISGQEGGRRMVLNCGNVIIPLGWTQNNKVNTFADCMK